MTDPTVSVIIANYNRADLLKLAIQSVLDQTYRDFEIVIFDDGSQDHSFEIINAYKKNMPDQVRVFIHEGRANKGIVATYREAISKARGEYVAFLEHDDQWSKNYLEKKVGILRNHLEVGVVFSPYQIVSDGYFGKDMVLRQWLLMLTIKRGKPFDNFSNLLRSNNVATFSCFMTRKALLEHLPLPPANTLAFDWWTLTQLSTQSLFYLDSSSYTLWRWSRHSAIGRQKFADHKDRGCRYMELMYHQVETQSKELSSMKGHTFETSQEHFSYFIDFYRNPGFIKFCKFFVRTPIWAMASAASLVINFYKFR